MASPSNTSAEIRSNDPVGPRLHMLSLHCPEIASSILPGQFVHLLIPGRREHILRRPFSVYSRDGALGTIDILYQEVGSLTSFMPELSSGTIEVMGPLGNRWLSTANPADPLPRRALLVGGGVGAAPLFMLAEELLANSTDVHVVLGAQTVDGLACLHDYEELLGCEPFCATDDGSYGHAGFCTGVVEERLVKAIEEDPGPYDYLAVCGPEPLMAIVSKMALDADIRCEVSLEKRMACGIGACLSCVVETISGKKRSCVDGPIFDAREVVW